MTVESFYAAMPESAESRIMRHAKHRHMQGRILLAVAGDFIDHSTPRCGCGERAGSSHSSAQPDPVGMRGPVTNLEETP